MLAKVSTPQLSRVLGRPRLFKRLDRARRARVIWLVGPPGAGKTTLVASWLKAQRVKNLWIQLDQGDGDVASFFHYLAMAASTLKGKPTLPPLSSESLSSMATFSRRFFRALFSMRHPPEVLVLDDYQEVPAAAPLHGALRDGLGELPEEATVVVLSHAEPPQEMARWLARGKLEVVRNPELALTRREAAGVARLWRYSGRGDDGVAAMHARTEGWPAGLVLLLAGGGGSSAPPQGRDERLFDYFAEEVFSRAEPETQRLLLETAILPRVEGETASRLTGIARATELLSSLARRGFFVMRHELAVPTFQMHALFRDFLLKRAQVTFSPARLAALGVEAASILAEAGALETAIPLFLDAQAWDQGAAAIQRVAPALCVEGRTLTLSRWLARIPEARRAADPWLMLWLGASTWSEQPTAGRAALARAYTLFRAARDHRGAALAWAFSAGSYLFALDDVASLDRWLDELDDLRADATEPLDPEVEARLAGAAFGALMSRRPWDQTLRHWEELAFSRALSPGRSVVRLAVGRGLAMFYGWWGADLPRARLLFDALGPLAAEGEPMSAIVWCAADAMAQLHRGCIEACLTAVERGLKASRDSGLLSWEPLLLGTRAWAALALGDLATSGAALVGLAAAAAREPRLANTMYHLVASLHARALGDRAVAREHALAALAHADTAGLALAQAGARLAAALAAPPELAQAEIRESLSFARRCRQRLVELAALAALALDASRTDEHEAEAHLREAFALARESGALHVVTLTRLEVSECCALALERGIEPEIAKAMISAMRLVPGPRGVELESWPWELRIEALGGLAIVRRGEQIAHGRKAQKKPLELLRLLVLRGPGGIRHDALSAALWPDADGDMASHALGTAVYRLRKLLGRAEAIVQADGRVALNASGLFVDVWALERLLERAETRSPPSASLRARVRSLYRGDLFGLDGEEPTFRSARDALRARVKAVLDR